jgi:hypothetical protein
MERHTKIPTKTFRDRWGFKSASAYKFIPMPRFYWPKEAIIDGTWKPPAVMPIPHMPG